jgi:hypothetical protein
MREKAGKAISKGESPTQRSNQKAVELPSPMVTLETERKASRTTTTSLDRNVEVVGVP